MPTDREVRAFLERGQRTLAQAQRVAAIVAEGKPMPPRTTKAVRLLAPLLMTGQIGQSGSNPAA
jgi:hypothetical protein